MCYSKNDCRWGLFPERKLKHGTVFLRQCIMIRSWSEVMWRFYFKKVQVGKDQEKAQSEKDSHSKNRGGKKPN